MELFRRVDLDVLSANCFQIIMISLKINFADEAIFNPSVELHVSFYVLFVNLIGNF